MANLHDELKHFPRYWLFVRGNHRSPVNSPYKGQWRGALMRSFICAWFNGWENNHAAGDLRRHCTHYDVTVIRHFCPMPVLKYRQHTSTLSFLLHEIHMEFGSWNTVQLRHNWRDGFSDNQPHDCLLNRLFRRRSKKTPKLRVTCICAGKHFHWRKCFWKCCLQNGGHFVLASVCYCTKSSYCKNRKHVLVGYFMQQRWEKTLRATDNNGYCILIMIICYETVVT